MKKEIIFIMTFLFFFQNESGMRAASISHDTLKVVDYVSLLTGDSIKYWDDESPCGWWLRLPKEGSKILAI